MRFILPRVYLCLVVGSMAMAGARPLAAQGRMAQTLDAFYAPSAAVFSADGRTLFVANSARVDYGLLAGRGAISRVSVAGDGQLTVENPRLVEGLNGPQGIAVLPVAVGPLPAGTLVVTVGGRWVVIDRNTPVTDARERGTGVQFFDPKTGARLGAIFVGDGSPVVGALGHAMLEPGPVAVDDRGTLFVADGAGVGLNPASDERERSGIVRLTPAAVEALLRDEAPPAGTVSFLPVPEVAGGVAWDAGNRQLYWATGPGYGDLAGAVLRLEGGEFGPGGRIRTVDKDLTAMVGACMTPGGSLLLVHAGGTVSAIKGGRGKVKAVRFREVTVFISPGQLAATTLDDGSVLVVVPERAGGGRPAWRHRVQTFTLPKGF